MISPQDQQGLRPLYESGAPWAEIRARFPQYSKAAIGALGRRRKWRRPVAVRGEWIVFPPCRPGADVQFSSEELEQLYRMFLVGVPRSTVHRYFLGRNPDYLLTFCRNQGWLRGDRDALSAFEKSGEVPRREMPLSESLLELAKVLGWADRVAREQNSSYSRERLVEWALDSIRQSHRPHG